MNPERQFLPTARANLTPVKTLSSKTQLTPEMTREIDKMFRKITSTSRFMIDRDAEEMAEASAALLLKILPDSTIGEIRSLGSGDRTAIHICGFPIPANIPPSPSLNGHLPNSWAVSFSDLPLLGAYLIAGIHPVSFQFENDGFLVRNVVPLQGALDKKSSHGAAELLPHTDNSMGHFNCDPGSSGISPIPEFLAFSGLRNADAYGNPVATNLLPLELILATLSEEELKILSSPVYTFQPPVSNSLGSREHMSILAKSGSGFFIRFTGEYGRIAGENAEATKALSALKKAIACSADKDMLHPVINPGDLLILNNYLSLHTRTTFEPGPNPNEWRWLRRIFGTSGDNRGTFVDARHWPHLMQ